MEKAGSIKLLSINKKNARRIFDGTSELDFRKQKPGRDLIDQKIYIYSTGDTDGIMGYCKFKGFMASNTVDGILSMAQVRRTSLAREIIEYYGPNYGVGTQRCYALQLSNPVKFDRPFLLTDMREIDSDFKMLPYINYISKNDPLFGAIIEWEKTFDIDGHHLKPTSDYEAERIINKYKR